MEWWQMLAFAVMLDFIYFKLKYSRPGGPPVHYGLPFIGYAFIKLLPAPLFRKLYKYYHEKGPNVLITRMPFVVVLLKNETISELQQNPDCLPRPRLTYTDCASWLATGTCDWNFFNGIRTSNIDQWQTSRKVGIAALYAGPRSKMIAKMCDTADVFLKEVEKHEGEKWNPGHSLMIVKIQEVMHLLFGTVMTSEDLSACARWFIIITENSHSMLTALKIFSFILNPVCRVLCSPLFRFNYWKDVYKGVIIKLYNDHSTSNSESDSRDYFAAIANSRKDNPDLLYYLREITSQTLMVGTHTTWQGLLSVLSLLALHPEEQQRVYEEIQKEINGDELTQENLDKLSYLKAAITEALRLYSPAAIPPRTSRTATNIGGYRVPRGLLLTPLIQTENYNPIHFPDPEKFLPSRHIDNQGKFFNDTNLGSFSRGKRACPGKAFFYMTAMVNLTKILQRYSVEAIDGVTDLGESRFDFLPSCGKLNDLRFSRRRGAPSTRDVRLNTKLSELVRYVLAVEDSEDH